MTLFLSIIHINCQYITRGKKNMINRTRIFAAAGILMFLLAAN